MGASEMCVQARSPACAVYALNIACVAFSIAFVQRRSDSFRAKSRTCATQTIRRLRANVSTPFSPCLDLAQTGHPRLLIRGWWQCIGAEIDITPAQIDKKRRCPRIDDNASIRSRDRRLNLLIRANRI
jgi:hypothetical protein